MKKHYRHEDNCLNCGTTLSGKYCHNCGQENLEIKESFVHMVNHAVSDYFHFDHQFFHTLRPLLFKPGKLTNEYLAGKRAQYLHPIKLYIFVSLVFFLLFLRNHKEETKVDAKSKKAQNEALDSARSVLKNDTNINKAVKVKISALGQKSLVEFKTSEDENTSDTGSVSSTMLVSKYTSYEAYLQAQDKMPVKERDNFLERYITRKKFDYKRKGEDPKKLVSEEAKHNFPRMMFLLLPLFALILRFGFWKNKKFYVEHLIFSVHLHCFLFLVLTVVLLINRTVPKSLGLTGWTENIAFFAVVFYIYKAFKAVYQRSRFRTITKMAGIFLAYSIVFTICLVMLFLISAATAA